MGLDRFVAAQDGIYPQALGELRAGSKRSHWMWFVFPQLVGLGRSPTAQFYAIADYAEGAAYACHPVLGARLGECTGAMLAWAGRRTAKQILGPIDAVKFRSSMTLFAACAADQAVFIAALDAFYEGERDPLTVARL